MRRLWKVEVRSKDNGHLFDTLRMTSTRRINAYTLSAWAMVEKQWGAQVARTLWISAIIYEGDIVA